MKWEKISTKVDVDMIKTRKFQKIVSCLFLVAMILSFVGCSNLTAADETMVSKAAASEHTAGKKPAEMKSQETEKPSETEATEASEEASQPTETEPPATQATEATQPSTQKTEPKETEPKETEPAHQHKYSATNTVAPTCTSQGYTTYRCDCGDSYNDDVVAATGHSWGDWTTTTEATTEAEGQQTRTCASCGGTETQAIDKLPAETIDTAALAAYGRQYGANTFGFEPVIGTRAGYFPGYCCQFTSMDDAYQEVAECVAATAQHLIAAGDSIVIEEDGQYYRAYLDVEVIHDHADIYYVWVYYG